MDVPYCFADEGYESEVAKLIDHKATAWKASVLSVYHPLLLTALDRMRPKSIYTKPAVHGILLHKNLLALAAAGSAPKIQFGEGDAVFV